LQRRVLLSLAAAGARHAATNLIFSLGLIGDAENAPARLARALKYQLLETGVTIERQRQGPGQLLASASGQEPGPRAVSRRTHEVDRGRRRAHPPNQGRALLFLSRPSWPSRKKTTRRPEDDGRNALLTNFFPGRRCAWHAVRIVDQFGVGAGPVSGSPPNHARRAPGRTGDIGRFPRWVDAASRPRPGCVLEGRGVVFGPGMPTTTRNAARNLCGGCCANDPLAWPLGDLMFSTRAGPKSNPVFRPGAAQGARREIENGTRGLTVENRWAGGEWNLARELQTRGKEGVAEGLRPRETVCWKRRPGRLHDQVRAGARAPLAMAAGAIVV